MREYPIVHSPAIDFLEILIPLQVFPRIPSSSVGKEKKHLLVGGGTDETASDMTPEWHRTGPLMRPGWGSKCAGGAAEG